MATLSRTSNDRLKSLGRRLRQVRLQRGQSMVRFSETLGLSVAALRSMERGKPGVTIGQWAETLQRLKCLGDLDALLAHPGPPTLYQHQVHRRCLRHRSTRPFM